MTFKKHPICSRPILLAGGARHRSAKIQTYRMYADFRDHRRTTCNLPRSAHESVSHLGNGFDHSVRHTQLDHHTGVIARRQHAYALVLSDFVLAPGAETP